MSHETLSELLEAFRTPRRKAWTSKDYAAHARAQRDERERETIRDFYYNSPRELEAIIKDIQEIRKIIASIEKGAKIQIEMINSFRHLGVDAPVFAITGGSLQRKKEVVAVKKSLESVLETMRSDYKSDKHWAKVRGV